MTARSDLVVDTGHSEAAQIFAKPFCGLSGHQDQRDCYDTHILAEFR